VTGRLAIAPTLAGILAVLLIVHIALATTRSPLLPAASPPAAPVSDLRPTASAATPLPEGTDTLPPHSSGPVEVAPRPGTPVRATVGQGRWHSIRTTYYGGSDGLDDGTHHFADGGLFRKGAWAIAANHLPLGTWLELRWKGRTVIAEVRDRHGKSVRPFLDLTVALSRALFGSPANHTIQYRRLP
jgi:hypothetical protein